jgi:hypothetical protein
VIIWNSSTDWVSEPIWTHQRDETASRAFIRLGLRGMIRLTGARQIKILDRKTLVGAGEAHFAIAGEARSREPYPLAAASVAIIV